MTDFEARVREALDAPCGCNPVKIQDGDPLSITWAGVPPLRECRICLPQRVAAAIEAATISVWDAEEKALATLQGERAKANTRPTG